FAAVRRVPFGIARATSRQNDDSTHVRCQTGRLCHTPRVTWSPSKRVRDLPPPHGGHRIASHRHPSPGDPMAPKSPTVRTTRRRLHAVGSGIETRVSAGTLDEHLPGLASLLEERAHTTDEDPHIVRVTAAGLTHDGIDVGLRPIDDLDDSVVQALTGYTAPPDWLAIGVSTGGNAYPIESAAEREVMRRVRLVHLVTRSGASASAVRLGDEDPQVLTSADPGRASGRVDDVCRRALALP